MHRQQKTRLPDSVKYVVYVLWLHGYTQGQIALHVATKFRRVVTPSQIRNLVRRSPYDRRSRMSTEDRQGYLNILKQDRIDRFAINEFVFTAGPIVDGRQK